MGPLFRCFNASSCEETLKIGLERIRTKFVSNGYPESIVESKINYMIEHNFKPPKSEKDVDKIYYFRCKFTDFKCDKIAQKMRTLIQKLFPKFLFRVAFSQIKLENFIHRRLKHQLDPFEKSGLVYDFTCCCMQRYIGETKRTLRIRVQEHSTSDKNSAIYQHIRSCKSFMSKYNETISETRQFSPIFALLRRDGKIFAEKSPSRKKFSLRHTAKSKFSLSPPELQGFLGEFTSLL